MDELSKLEMRNYASAVGYLVIATLTFLSTISTGTGLGRLPGNVVLMGMVVLLVAGIILAVLHNRDLTAITFLMIGMFYFFLATDSGAVSFATPIVGVLFFLFGCVILTAADTKKYLLCILPFLYGLTLFIAPLIAGVGFAVAILPIITLVCTYFSIAVSSEKISLPGGAALRKDVVTDFKTSGSVLGYLLFLLNALIWASYYFLGEEILSLENCLALDAVCGIMMILAAVLLFTIAKMRFTPAMFLVLGFLIYIGSFVTDVLLDYPIGIMMIVLALIAFLRNESRILVGVMMFICGISYLFAAVFGEVSSSLAGVVSLVPGLIALYLTFAIFSQKKLPLF